MLSFYLLTVKVRTVKCLQKKQVRKKTIGLVLDQLGRDLWTRTWKGAQISLYIGVVAALLDICIGVVYGAVSGFFEAG